LTVDVFTLDALPCAAVLTDGAGVVVGVNAALQSFAGVPEAGWPGQRIDDMLPVASRMFLHTHVWPTLLGVGRIDEVNLQLKTVRDQTLPVLVNARLVHPATDPRDMRFSWALFPVRERHRFENELLIARQRMEHLVQSTGAGTWEWNVRTGEVRINERWATILGWSLVDLGPVDNQFRASIAHPDELARTRHLLREHFAGRSESYVNEIRLRRRDGSWVWVQDRGRLVSRTADGRPEWMFGIHIDISTIKAQEEALRRNEELLNRTNELAGVGGCEFDLRTQDLYWSDQTCRIHGVPVGYQPSLAEALEFYPPQSRVLIEQAIRVGTETGDGWDLEVPFVRRDGAPLMVHALGRVQSVDGVPVRLVGAFQDITARVQQQAQLRALARELSDQHELLRVTLQSIGDAVITTDVEGRVTWLNPVAERLTGWSRTQAQGCALVQVFRLVHEHTRAPAPDSVRACLEQDTVASQHGPAVLISRDGREFGVEDSAAPIRGADGRVHGAVLVFHDVTDERRRTSEMRYRASHDALTGLYNRTELEARLRDTLERARADDSQHVLLFLDLDQFKLVNDACGHACGDELLQQVARLLQHSVRGSDMLARLGGDEFAVILDHCTSEQALRVAGLICERMDSYRYVHDGQRFRVGTSIGLLPIDGRWADTGALMKAADAACYAAKQAGRNRVHVWRVGDMALTEHPGQTQWATRLARALDEDRFVLHAQRIAPLAGSTPGPWRAEVLVRLVESDGSLVMPGAFLPAAERFKLAGRVDLWVLRQTLQLLGGYPAVSGGAMLSVNLASQSLCDPVCRRQLLDLLASAGEEACHGLCLEIAETTAIGHLADASAFAEQVRRMGVRIALDGVGAGSSTFGYLKQLRVDELKIDSQFIGNLPDDPLDQVAVRAIVDVARVLTLQTVAEGVERSEQLERLQSLGVCLVQGSQVHRPEPLEPMLRALAG